MEFARRVLLAAAACGALCAQSFEVASVKPSKEPDFRGMSMQYMPGGRLAIHNYPLLLAISQAYDIPPQSPRLRGGPQWIWSERYDIEAKADPSTVPPGLPDAARRKRMRKMLQALLADRFHLAVHTETKEDAVYALVIGKSGPKLQKSAIAEQECDEKCHVINGGQGRGIHARAIDMADLARALENFADRPVVERTGIQGLYDVDTTAWMPMRGKPPASGSKAEDGSDADTMPTMFTVVERLGLKLESQRAPTEIVVIDRVERPAEN